MTAGGDPGHSPETVRRVIPYQEDERVDGTGTGYVPTDEESAALNERIDAALDDISARIAALPMTLDDAWRETEAALGPDRRMGSVRAAVAFDGRRTSVVGWTATAHDRTGIGQSGAIEGPGPTPAAALQALAARLRDSR